MEYQQFWKHLKTKLFQWKEVWSDIIKMKLGKKSEMCCQVPTLRKQVIYFFSTNIFKKSAQSFFVFGFNSPALHYHIHAYTKPLKCIFFCSTFVCFNIDFWFSSKIAAIFSHHKLSDEWWSESLWFEFSQCRTFIDRTHGIYITKLFKQHVPNVVRTL